jgi:peptidoglycan DL-endopeptidase LytE
MKKLILTTSLIGTLLFGGQVYANSTYIVRNGDTLSGIAKTYETTVNSIVGVNNLSGTNILVGQKLTIPSDKIIQGEMLMDGNKIIGAGHKYIGARYLFGASETRIDAFDCSSFTKRVFLENGINLPRTSRDQAAYGKAISLSEAKTGDLLFYDTDRDGVINHVGIFVAPNKMLHASPSNGVRYTSTESYWNARFVKAVRVLLPQPNTQTIVSVANTLPFNDISKLWNKEQVLSLHELGIIKGMGNKFMPSMEIPRSQLVVMISRALDLKGKEYNDKFVDVTTNDWFASELMSVVDAGIINGKSTLHFAPKVSVTREEAAKMVYQTLLYNGLDPLLLDNSKSVNEFTDYEEISVWARESVDILIKAEIVSGKKNGSFDPKGKLTRAEMAKIIYKMLQFTNGSTSTTK